MGVLMEAYSTKDLQTARGIILANISVAMIDEEIATRTATISGNIQPKTRTKKQSPVLCPICGEKMVRVKTAPGEPFIIGCRKCRYSKIVGDK